MKSLNITRLVWVIFANASAGVLIVRNILSERRMYELLQTSMPSRVYVIPCIGLFLLIIGIVVELAHTRVAKYINISVFLVPTIYALWLFIASYHTSMEGRAYSLLLGVPCAMVTLITWLTYRRWGRGTSRTASAV
jgi:hypothetical protein